MGSTIEELLEGYEPDEFDDWIVRYVFEGRDDERRFKSLPVWWRVFLADWRARIEAGGAAPIPTLQECVKRARFLRQVCGD